MCLRRALLVFVSGLLIIGCGNSDHERRTERQHVRVAAQPPAGLTAVATLSAERRGRSLGDALPYARRTQIRSLYVGGTEDGWTTLGADTRAFHRATPAKRKRIVLVPGDAHGVDLLSGVHGAQIGRLLSGFIRNR